MRKSFLASIIFVSIAGLTSGYLYQINYFDDPAIAGCEIAIIESLRSPSSYKRVSANIYINKVTIKYDAQNAYGTQMRGSQDCHFQYYDDKFQYVEAETDSKEAAYSEALFNFTVSSSIGYSLLQNKTDLRPSADDALIDSCVKSMASDIGVKSPPSLDSIGWTFLKADNFDQVAIRTLKSVAKFPRNFVCRFEKDGKAKVVLKFN